MFGHHPHEPRFGPNTLVITQMIQELQAKALTPHNVVEFGSKVFDCLVGNRQLGFSEMLNSFVEAQDVVALWRFQHPGPDNDALASHALRVLAVIFGYTMPAYTDGYDVLGKAQRGCQQLALLYPAGTDEGFLASERVRGIEMLRHEYHRRVGTLTAIQELIPNTDEWDLSDQAIERYYGQATELAGYLSNYSAHTVKPCFVQDGMLHAPTQACVILDGPELYGKMGERAQSGYAIPQASMHITNRSQITTTDFKLVPNDPYGKTTTLTAGYKILLGFDLHYNGALTTDPYGYVPLQQQFAIAVRPEVFPLFWLMQLMRLSDLVIPIVKRREHGIPSFPQLAGPRKAREKQTKNMPRDFPKLWLPRLRALADPATASAIEVEIREDEELTERKTRKIRGRAGHWRRLLPHQKASPAAIAKSLLERKQPPPEGHTYVKRRNHEDGYEARRSSR